MTGREGAPFSICTGRKRPPMGLRPSAQAASPLWSAFGAAAKSRAQAPAKEVREREGKALTLQLGPASSTVGAISSTAATPPQQVLPRKGSASSGNGAEAPSVSKKRETRGHARADHKPSSGRSRRTRRSVSASSFW
jgi:hypothetical protein